MTLATDEDVAVFCSRPWIALNAAHAASCVVGARYRFRVTSLEEGVSGTRLSALGVTGDILMQMDRDASDVVVGGVAWSARNVAVNEVDAYLRKHGVLCPALNAEFCCC